MTSKEYRESMRLTIDYNNMMSSTIGDKGFTDKQLSSLAPLARKAYDFVAENRGKDELFMGWYCCWP